MKNWIITKFTKEITDDRQDKYTHKKLEGDTIKFRLLDDDGIIYMYGEMLKSVWDNGDEDDLFEPLDWAEGTYGCTEIQFKENGKYETL